MPLQCNINARGKALRLTGGIIAVAGGTVIVLFHLHENGSFAAWIAAAACILVGAFMIFEARAGWCILRALGFRTPI